MSTEMSMPSFEFDATKPEVVMFSLLQDAEKRLRQGLARDMLLLDGQQPDIALGESEYAERYVSRELLGGRQFGLFHITEDYDALLAGEGAKNWRVGIPVHPDMKSLTPLHGHDTSFLLVGTNIGRLVDMREVSLDTVDELVLVQNAAFSKLPAILNNFEDYRLIHGK